MQCDICFEEKKQFYSLHDEIHCVCKQCFNKIKTQEKIICPFCRRKIYTFINIRKITYI